LDQFGVLHDGQRALPGAQQCFEELAGRQKQMVVLSNTSRRRAFAIKKWPQLGFDETKLAGFVTSGEAAWEHMAENYRGKKVLWISWESDFQAWDATFLDGLDVTLADASTADVVLLQGSQQLRTTPDVAEAVDTGVSAPPPTRYYPRSPA
jgi:ribonucleotide monophosphatase NagD (HAD superfamily)